MASKNLTFKLVMDADSKSFVSGVKQSQEAAQAVFNTIRLEAEKLRDSTQSSASGISSIGNEAKSATPKISQLENELKKSNASLENISIFAGKSEQAVSSLKTGFIALAGAMAAMGIGTSAQEIVAVADEFRSLESRIRLAVGATGDFHGAMAGVQRIAIETRSSLVATGELFATISRSAKTLKLNQEQVLSLTKTINEATIVGGGSAASNEAAILQLNQALQSGVLRGDEFNSIMEQAPRITQALADGLGTTTGKLREMAEAGRLTSDVVVKALQSQSSAIDAEFQKMPVTVGGALQNLKTSWMLYIGEVDKANGVSEKVAGAIQFVAKNIDELVSALKFAAEVAIAFKAVGLAQTLLAKANAAQVARAAIAAETAALTTNTQANISNSQAATTNAAAHSKVGGAVSGLLPGFTSAAGGISNLLLRFGAYGVAAFAFLESSKLIGQGLKATGTAIGEGIASWALHRQGLKNVEEAEAELAAQEEIGKKKQEEAAAAKAKHAQQMELLKQASYGLNEVSQKVIDDFDKQIKSGEGVQAALKGVASSFQFTDMSGINNGLTALMALEKQGKASHEQVKAALTGALSGQDLVAFQTNASAMGAKIQVEMDKVYVELTKKKEAYEKWKQNSDGLSYDAWDNQSQKYKDGIQEIETKLTNLRTQQNNAVQAMALVHEAVLDEAVKRSGISYEELQGKSTEAFRKARGDVDIVVGSLDELKNQGVNTGRLLGASLGKAIDTTTNQGEIDALKRKITSLKGSLGETLTNGLLQQAEQKLIDINAQIDKTTPGINSVAEAFSIFGMKTPAELKGVAEQYKQAFLQMKNSGQATLSQQQEAFKKYAETAIAANKGVSDGFLESQASALDLKIEVDNTGKSSIKSMSDMEQSLNRVGNAARGDAADGFRELGKVAREEAKDSITAWNDALDAKAKADKENQGQRIGKSFTTYNKADIQSKLKSMGYSDADAAKQAESIMAQARSIDVAQARQAQNQNGSFAAKAFEDLIAKGQTSIFGTKKVDELLANAANTVNNLAPKISQPVTTTTTSEPKTQRYEITNGNQTAEFYGNEKAGTNLDAIFTELERFKKSM